MEERLGTRKLQPGLSLGKATAPVPPEMQIFGLTAKHSGRELEFTRFHLTVNPYSANQHFLTFPVGFQFLPCGLRSARLCHFFEDFHSYLFASLLLPFFRLYRFGGFLASERVRSSKSAVTAGSNVW
jgi:hypothetical protein